MPALPDPRPPTSRPPVVPGYTLEVLLGRGGSGEVWRAVPRAGGPAVAIKVLLVGDPERQAREATLLGELDHPHLVRLHEVVHQPGRGSVPRVALVLDLLAGGSLAALLARRGRLRPGEVVTAIAPVAAALAHAHGRGVVHGDLSPGNIVFTAEGRPVLTDLGVARVLGEAASGEVTPAYVDPTVARGAAPGPASDVFGIAAAAFHALTGVAPWNAAGPADTLAVAAAGDLPDLDELAADAPAELRAVIARGLFADPADRGTAAAFALDLRSACRPEPVRLPRTGVPDEELGRTGRGPRTELTHQVRRPAAAAPVAPPVRVWWRRGAAAFAAFPSRALPRRAAMLVVLAVLLGAVAWAGGHWTGGPVGRSTAGGDTASTRTGGASTGGVHDPRPAAASPAASAEPSSPGGAPASADPASADEREQPATVRGWQELVGELYGRRARAFATGDAGSLGGVYVPGSAALAADVQALGALQAEHRLVRGFAPVVDEVTGVSAADGRVQLRLVDRWPGYDVVAANAPDGPALATAAPHAPAAATMVLVRTAAGWRVDSVTREPP